MSFRKLIAKAMQEARDEYDHIINKKLGELFGDGPAPREKKAAPAAAAAAAAPKAAPAGKKEASSGKRERVNEAYMTQLKEKILGAFEVGVPLKKGDIMSKAKLSAKDALRVGLILRKMKDDNVLSMTGDKGTAAYTKEK